MFSLYELTEDYLELLAMAEDPETDEQCFIDTLEGIDGALEDKADNYVKIMKQLETNEAGLDAEIKRLQARKDAMKKKSETMKKSLQSMMEATGKEKFKTELFSYNIQNNPPKLILTCDENDIPIQYLIAQDPKIDRTKIKNDIKSGMDIDFAHLESDRSLRIR